MAKTQSKASKPVLGAPSTIAVSASGADKTVVTIAGVNGANARKADGMAIIKDRDPRKTPVFELLDSLTLAA